MGPPARYAFPMSDNDDHKIVSLDQRRRADQARQKAELAAAAARKKQNGSSRPLNQPHGQPLRRAGGSGGVARGLGGVIAWLVWGGLAAMLALSVFWWVTHPGEQPGTRPPSSVTQPRTVI